MVDGMRKSKSFAEPFSSGVGRPPGSMNRTPVGQWVPRCCAIPAVVAATALSRTTLWAVPPDRRPSPLLSVGSMMDLGLLDGSEATSKHRSTADLQLEQNAANTYSFPNSRVSIVGWVPAMVRSSYQIGVR